MVKIPSRAYPNPELGYLSDHLSDQALEALKA